MSAQGIKKPKTNKKSTYLGQSNFINKSQVQIATFYWENHSFMYQGRTWKAAY